MAAEAAISTAVELLGNLLIQKVNFLRGVRGEVQSLREELNMMQSFLRDANKKRTQDERVRNWISDIREVALDAEDAINMFNLNVENPRSKCPSKKSCLCPLNHVPHLQRIGKDVKSIRAKLEAVRINRETYGIKDLGEPGESAGRLEVEARRRLSPREKDEHLVGVENDVKKLLEPVMDEEKGGLWVSAIVGMGGIGKSTLAREVYNHPDIVYGRFDCRAWVVLSSEFTLQETTKQLILETTTSGTGHEKQQLLNEIKQLEMKEKEELLKRIKELETSSAQEKQQLLSEIKELETGSWQVKEQLLNKIKKLETEEKEEFLNKIKELETEEKEQLLTKIKELEIKSGKKKQELFYKIKELETSSGERIQKLHNEIKKLDTSSGLEKQQLLKEMKELEETMRDGLYVQRKLEELLHSRLEGKTYFIVLDDVWEKEHWDSLMNAFPKGQDKTSRILVTTRNKIIANQCQNFHEMKFLDPEKSWELFLKKGLSGDNNEEFPKQLEQIGRRIVEKCKGLPLSITLMGGLLAETRSNRVWEEALNELDSHLGRAENSVSKILEAILELSYENLSPKLKSCFMCFAYFKEDATISVKRLLNIIVGLGLTGTTTAASEDIARGYLDELINKNVVQVMDLTLDNRIKSCHLHDSLHRICLEKAEKEIGLENLMGDPKISLQKPRHRVVEGDDLWSFSENHNKHIRSLFLLYMKKDCKEVKSSYWKSFQQLKILDFDYTNFHSMQPRLSDFLPLLLGLKQLRIYRQHEPGELMLPTGLNTLKKLELLDLRTEIVHSPNVAVEMDSLRHIHAHRVQGLMITDSCKNLETLKYINHKDWKRSTIRLMDGCPIRKLGIHLDDDELSGVRASLENLEKMKNLVKLYFTTLRPINASVIPRFTNVSKLKLKGRMSGGQRARLNANLLPPNLVHLTLEESFLYEDPMQELGKLAKLSYLKLKKNSYYGKRMQVLHDGFPKLRGLSLLGLKRLKSIDIEEGGMPQLELLQVSHCPDLSTSNLSNEFYQLQILDTKGSRYLVSNIVVK